MKVNFPDKLKVITYIKMAQNFSLLST